MDVIKIADTKGLTPKATVKYEPKSRSRTKRSMGAGRGLHALLPSVLLAKL